ncbi:MAG: fatty acid kinase fatty acid binding subunit [Actinomycetota bacterium]|jgi:DegV family protein with EDD domain|nr:fatty acid kinase fatty acid binding subunit [Actinomycetota bacterium]
MTGRTAIVTDSTAYLPASVVAEHAIRVVPLQVVIGGRSYAEGVDAKSSDVAQALRAWVPVSTSRPGPAAFLDTYEQLADDGADAIVSVHLSAEMSGTFESAVLAARDSPVPVRVVDSRSMGMGMGYAVVTASRVAAGGAGPDEVAAAAEKRAAATTAVFYVDTLEYLRRGGRIGAGAALLGSALAVKPLLHLVDGRIEPLEKVRTATRAIARMEELAVGHAGDAEVDVAVHHLANPDRAESLAERMRARLPHLGHLHVSEVGAVVGAHVGPGMLAVVVAPR